MDDEAAIAERFAQDVAQHTVRVLHEDGLYRHLLVRDRESFMYWYEVITTPGQLTIRGDMGTYVFARLDDMFEFFGSKQRINPGYWGEKLLAASSPVKHYSPQVAVQHAKEALADLLEYRELEAGEEAAEAVKHAFNSEVLPEAAEEAHFREALSNFEFFAIRFEDTWEWDLTEWDMHFLWNLHAIVWAIKKWTEGEVQR